MKNYLGILILLAVLLAGLAQTTAQQPDDRAGVKVILEGEAIDRIGDFARIVPEGWIAPPDTQPRFEIRVISSTSRASACSYTGGIGKARIIVNVEVVIRDLMTDEQIAAETFTGSTPNCPKLTNSSTPLYGRPALASFSSWLVSTLSGLADLSGAPLILPHNDHWVWDVEFSPDGQLLLTADEAGMVRLWNAITGEELRVITRQNDRAISAKFSPDGHSVITAERNSNTAWVWNATDEGNQLFSLLHTASVNKAEFTLDGRILTSTHSDVTLWDASTGETIATYADVRYVAWHPIINAPMSLEDKQIVRNLQSGEVWVTLDREVAPPSNLVGIFIFGPDGSQILTVASNLSTALIWSSETGQEIFQLVGHTASILSASYSPSGRYIVTSSADHSVRVWNARTGEEILQLTNHVDVVEDAAFSPDELYLASSSWDGTAQITYIGHLIGITDIPNCVGIITLNLHETPDQDSEWLATLPGTAFQVIGHEGDYFQIIYEDQQGWIPADFVELVSPDCDEFEPE